ncbi:hypothetical protein HY405_01555 [Candidatus Microgenomates bacterium]|nr:hypothetical protein [Candidatus Microgenomates bacterium]
MRFDRRYIEKLIKPIEKRKAVATFTKEEYVANPGNIWSRCWNINSYLPQDLHIDPNLGDEANNFRAIGRDVFLKTKGYRDVGYGEDVTVLAQLPNIKSLVAPGAVCYHYNPESLAEVFTSARWMGRGELGLNPLIYLLPNSLRRGIWEVVKHKIPHFLLFKVVFDFGVLVGIIERKLGGGHAK